MSVVFEWDQRKARTNLGKHRISFAEALSVFRDPLGRIFGDKSHSDDEIREILVGHSASKHLLVVCFTQRAENCVRIISARHATKKERSDYEEYTSH